MLRRASLHVAVPSGQIGHVALSGTRLVIVLRACGCPDQTKFTFRLGRSVETQVSWLHTMLHCGGAVKREDYRATSFGILSVDNFHSQTLHMYAQQICLKHVSRKLAQWLK